jgi:hypothetical protein
MAFSPVIQRYFQEWIGKDTWYAAHPLDRKPFYTFAHAAKRYGRGITSDRLKQEIIQAVGPDMEADQLEQHAQKFADLFGELMDFSQAPTKDFVVEKTNIHAYHMQLQMDMNHDKSKIAQKMKADWGDDWEKQLKQLKKPKGS